MTLGSASGHFLQCTQQSRRRCTDFRSAPRRRRLRFQLWKFEGSTYPAAVNWWCVERCPFPKTLTLNLITGHLAGVFLATGWLSFGGHRLSTGLYLVVAPLFWAPLFSCCSFRPEFSCPGDGSATSSRSRETRVCSGSSGTPTTGAPLPFPVNWLSRFFVSI